MPENKMKKGCPKRKNSAVLALLRPGGTYQDSGDKSPLTNKFERNIKPVANKRGKLCSRHRAATYVLPFR